VEKDLFDASSPGGLYNVNLSEPYGQMVAEECLYLLNFRVGCELRRIEYSPNSFTPPRPVHMKRMPVPSKTASAPAHMKTFCRALFDSEAEIGELVKLMGQVMGCFELYPSNKLCRRIISIMKELLEEEEALSSHRKGRAAAQEEFEHNLLHEIFRALFRIADEDLSGSM
jgi:hypothetical protein